MADVYTFVTTTGTIEVNTSVIQTQVNTEFTTAFGSDLIVTPDNPQGVLITGEIAARTAVADNNAQIANQINPNLAGGVYLDAILALTGTQRVAATYTQVAATVTGVSGTIIPVGSLAEDGASPPNQYALTEAVTIGSGGSAAANFQAVNSGALTLAIGALDTVASNVIGWTNVTNAAIQYYTGTAVQTDNAARIYRRNTLFAQGTAISGAIIAAVSAVPQVTSVFFQENDTDATLTIPTTVPPIYGVSMVANSIYVVVAGGGASPSTAFLAAVAAAIDGAKSAGCAYNNGLGVNQSVVVTDPYSGQAKTVLFDTPNLIPIEVIVYASAGSSVVNPTLAIQQAIVDYANGVLSNGNPGLTVGMSVSPYELAGAIAVENPGIYVSNIKIAPVSTGTYVEVPIVMNPYQQATIAIGNISVEPV
jgi:hypothetical protein